MSLRRPDPRLVALSAVAAVGAAGCLLPDPEAIRGQKPAGADAAGGESADAATPGAGGAGGARLDGGGGSGGAVADRPPPAADAATGPLLPPSARADNCADFGASWCEKQRRCERPVWEGHGGEALCASRLKLWCELVLTSNPDSNWTPEALNTCMTSWNTLTCSEFHDTTEILVGPACVVPGKRPDGSPCGTFTHCASTYCSAVVSGCGRCSARLSAGSPCGTNSDCQRGLACSASMRCALAGSVGAACDNDRPCRLSLYCKMGRCSEREGENGACAAHRDCRPELVCSNLTRRCGLAIAAQMCDSRRVDGTTTYCAGGGRCLQDGSNTCLPASIEGGECSDAGKRCLFPSACAAGSCMSPPRPACSSAQAR
jgi:hypothetical protein